MDKEDYETASKMLAILLAIPLTYLFLPWWLKIALGFLGYSVTFKNMVGAVMLVKGIKVTIGKAVE